MRDEELLSLLSQSGVLMTDGHFKLGQKMHGSFFINRGVLDDRREVAQKIGRKFAIALCHRRQRGRVVLIGLGRGGGLLVPHVAGYMSSLYFCPSQTVRIRDKIPFDGREIVLVKDVITTGRSVKSVVDELARAGGRVAEVVTICNRGQVTAEALGIGTLTVLVDLGSGVWSTDECRQSGPCSQGTVLSTLPLYFRSADKQRAAARPIIPPHP